MQKQKKDCKQSTRTFRVLFIPTFNAGVAFYRIHNFVDIMNKHADVMALPTSPKQIGVSQWENKLSRQTPGHGMEVLSNIISLVKQTDIVVFQLFHTEAGCGMVKMIVEAIKNDGVKKKVFTEIDDDFLNVNPEIIGHMAYHPGSQSEEVGLEQLRSSHGVIVSTDALRKLYKKYNKNTYVIPNCIDFKIWDLVWQPKKNGKIRIGFAGGSGHVKDLELIDKAVTHITNKYKNVEFVFFGGVPTFLHGRKQVKTIQKHAPINRYPQALGKLGLDIGLAPLHDNMFNRGKSNLRWLEYSALKVPTIASDVEPFRKSIISGKTGLICKKEADWVKNIEHLIENKSLRKEIGENAYKYVKNSYNTEIIGKHYVDYLRRQVK
jgi:glycosyltransferase involved in cell wall biosynthesis